MAVKTNGKTWKAFQKDNAFWGDKYMDETLIEFDGSDDGDVDYDQVADTAVVVIKEGYVTSDEDETFKGMSLTAFFNKWKKLQTTTVVTVTVDTDRMEEFKALMKANKFQMG